MKKFVLSIFAASALIFASCSSDDDKNNDKEPIVEVNPDNFTLTIKDGQHVKLINTLEYNLTGPVIVEEGGKLTIPAGTVIKASGGTSAYIAVAQKAEIFINGEANNPVVMTSASANPAPGDWGGLVVCGQAPTNKGATAQAEVSDLTYGGTNVNDNSGVIKYLRVEYTGAEFNGAKQFNGVSFFGVGNGTKVEYIQSYNGKDDGIEFFGGTVNGKYLVSTGSGDDSIDFADGWAGTGEYWYIKDGAKAGIEGSNNGDDFALTPLTNATLKNISIVGGGSEGGLYIKEGGGKWNASNIYVDGFEVGVHLKGAEDDPQSNQQVANGDITFNNIQFVGVDTKTDYIGDLPENFLQEGTNTGAGNGAELPDWAQGWTK
ncbi:hypothetical protein GGR32_001732 [Mesonia hippocampi]|uniref:Multidrug transporter n=1 Tax=Mesonia hippocampi TaxID=1628250 RepID=A0A840EZI3_9FLAO|nr:hypothetical protein [Mesonia hippocampi]MBB4119434.1 hypothetical protein [Mesonia hippocampi]